MSEMQMVGPVEPHMYTPDWEAMGDCATCGNVQEAPVHIRWKLTNPIQLANLERRVVLMPEEGVALEESYARMQAVLWPPAPKPSTAAEEIAGAEERTDMAFWWPLVKQAADRFADDLVRINVPETVLIETDANLMGLLDGVEPEGFMRLVEEIQEAADSEAIGAPFFLRTGHASGKHSWASTCYVEDATAETVAQHVFQLVEESALAGIMGLPTNVWAVRRLIPTTPLFRVGHWEGFPVVREFRVFIRDDAIEAIYPYWPADALEGKEPDSPDWRLLLEEASKQDDLFDTPCDIATVAGMVSGAIGGGYWSMDFLQASDGSWWLTDMADGSVSWRPDIEIELERSSSDGT